MKVCVLLPDYSTSDVDYQYYDPPRMLDSLLPGDTVTTVFLNKLTTYRQLSELSREGFDIFVNLCEGYLEWEVPSIDVPYSLELLNLPFTGPSSLLYDPSKELMKYVAFCSEVAMPAYVVIRSVADIKDALRELSFPMFVKPLKAGDSLGVDDQSLVCNEAGLQLKVEKELQHFDALLVESYISGREFTVLVAANEDGRSCTTYKPVEYVFPGVAQFKTYALKTSELHPNCNVPIDDPELETALRTAAKNIFQNFGGVGYARLDFRVDASGKIYFLEINFTCSVFYSEGYEGSADYILKFDGTGQQAFLKHIIAEGIGRYRRRQKKYVVRGNSIAGYGVYATRDIHAGEVIFEGEGRAQRIITRRYVEECWSPAELDAFTRYAYPIGNEVYILWDNDPSEWAPQNHCCDPNTCYSGLNVVALRKINKSEELTLDYGKFLDDKMMPFDCQCGSAKCRGRIEGIPGNTPFCNRG
ncbi:MAG TPA: SET domain-containing protein-lysine N-methyltransferase [Chitinophagaceae bacterium]